MPIRLLRQLILLTPFSFRHADFATLLRFRHYADDIFVTPVMAFRFYIHDIASFITLPADATPPLDA
jgi:hypothetical protein